MSSGEIQLRISRRARRLRIDVSARGGVIVVIPEGTPRDVVRRFVIEKREWIRRARTRVEAEADALLQPLGPPVPESLQLRALGREYAVEIRAAKRGRVDVDGERLHVHGPREPARIRATLARWLKGTARDHFVPRLDALAETHGLGYERVAVRGQRTRWASCSGRGTISLNYKLLFLPPALVDHVLLHELAHTRHLNHSRQFWELLARLDPHWRRHHAALARAARWLPAWVEMDAR